MKYLLYIPRVGIKDGFYIVLSFYFSGERALKEISYFIINAVCAFLNK